MLMGTESKKLTNHLGNVLVVVSDKRIGVAGGGGMNSGWLAEILSISDYYPFGSPMAGRTWSDPNRKYRYGFNGQEKDDEIDAEGGNYSFTYRIHNSRLGRFLSVDPLNFNYPSNSCYAYAENDVIRCIDLEGLEKIIVIAGNGHDRTSYQKDRRYIHNCAKRGAKVYNVKLVIVENGKEMADIISTGIQPISRFYYYGHSWSKGIYLNNNSGFYSDVDPKRNIDAYEMPIQNPLFFNRIENNAIFTFISCGTLGAGQLDKSSFGFKFLEWVAKNELESTPLSEVCIGQTKTITVSFIGADNLVNIREDGSGICRDGNFYKVTQTWKLERHIEIIKNKKWRWWKIFSNEKKYKVSIKDEITLIDEKIKKLGKVVKP